jgi:nucleoside-diphosphate-sugar epimerase
MNMPAPQTVDELEDHLSTPPRDLVETLSKFDGDIAFIGVGGKMGPTMARMARRALDAAGSRQRVYGVARFTDDKLRQKLASWGIETVACDLLAEDAAAKLPDAKYVVSMSGFKFGATENPSYSWGMNCYVPAVVCRRYREAKLVAFSTGNVYGMVPLERSPGVPNFGSRESDPLRADGEYSMTAIGRERMYDYFSRALPLPTTVLRLNYATELRYGVLVDLAQDIFTGRPVNLATSRVNVLWLADANAMTLRAFQHVASPARAINLAGEPVLNIREVASEMGRLLDKPVQFLGQEATSALLNDGRDGYSLLGRPEMSAEQMIRWTADWVAHGRESLGKPTHFQVRDGVF